jgi:glycosyltransferase involved in cell wall biosynthesis
MTAASPAAARADRIAVLLPSLEGGGAERSMLTLIAGFLAAGRSVDLVLCQAKGAYLGEIPPGATMTELQHTGWLATRWLATARSPGDFFALLRPVLLARKIAPEIARLDALRRYIEVHRPDVVLSALTYANLVAIWAKQQARSPIPVVVSERIALSSYCADPANSRKWRWRYLPELVRRTYAGANAVVAVSHDVAEDLVTTIGLGEQSVTAIRNPVVDDTLRARARQAPAHPWFVPGAPPVILAVGRLTEQKDFATLMRAFAVVRATRESRLVILGEGRLRDNLEALATALGIRADVDLPGFVENPFQYMARAAVLVLSSQYEGLPGVLIQALACGCPVVSTDCPGGSREILADGKYGALVDVGDASGIADAILAEFDTPTPRDRLLHRAEEYSVAHGVNNYLALLDSVVAQTARRA